MAYKPILATLGYVLSPARDQVLLIHRNRQADDLHFGKYNGLGGKLQPDEDIVSCITREVREEAGIECLALTLRGTVSWPGFGKSNEDWFGFIFRIDAWQGTPKIACAEGDLEWIPIDALASLPLWEGDRHFLPLVFGESAQQFHGVMPYKSGKPLSWSYHSVGL
jgi:8-oxo-dGTP diphosphatase